MKGKIGKLEETRDFLAINSYKMETMLEEENEEDLKSLFPVSVIFKLISSLIYTAEVGIRSLTLLYKITSSFLLTIYAGI